MRCRCDHNLSQLFELASVLDLTDLVDVPDNEEASALLIKAHILALYFEHQLVGFGVRLPVLRQILHVDSLVTLRGRKNVCP